MASSSIVGVSSLLYQTPSLQIPAKHPIPPSFCLPLSGSKLRTLKWVSSAIATPNSVLSEEAFKGLGDFSKGSFDVSDEEEFDEGEEGMEGEIQGSGVSEDELDVAKLGLPQKLVESLSKRGITQLFPIQVLLFSLSSALKHSFFVCYKSMIVGNCIVLLLFDAILLSS